MRLANSVTTPDGLRANFNEARLWSQRVDGVFSGVLSSDIAVQWGRVTGTPTTLAGYGIADAQPLDSDLTTIAANITAAGHALLDDANAAAQRTTLGLGTIATQNSNSVSITGGTITGITALTVAVGGTGADTEAGARAKFEVPKVTVDESTPGDPVAGDLWHVPSTHITYIFDGSDWYTMTGVIKP